MKKCNILFLLCGLFLAACSSEPVKSVAKPASPSVASKPATSTQAGTGTNNSTKPGGYYLDDGPGDNPPKDIDSIANAVPKKEVLLDRSNKPYKALGATYTPMTSYQPYKDKGIASWYGKRYHGKKTSSGEVYDMYSMSAAHTTLPLPSYVKVTNPANGRFVVVRVNDRGPFKSSRIIDLSYAAAYKLRFSAQGSGLVEVEAIDPNNTSASYIASYTQPTNTASTPLVAKSAAANPTAVVATAPAVIAKPANTVQFNDYFVQVGAFKSEANADLLLKKIQALDISQNAGINSVYNNGLYRLKLGPFDTKQEADQVATNIRKQLNTSAIITNQ